MIKGLEVSTDQSIQQKQWRIEAGEQNADDIPQVRQK